MKSPLMQLTQKILLHVTLPFIAGTGEGSCIAYILDSDFVKIWNYGKMKIDSSIFLTKFFEKHTTLYLGNDFKFYYDIL